MAIATKHIKDDTIKHFKPYYENLVEVEAVEIVQNFTGFARLMLKLDKKRQEKERGANDWKTKNHLFP